MSGQFLGEIRLFPFNFAPFQWAQCAGQLLSITQNTALFSLLGTFYGGNGTSTFALPDLRGRVPIGAGSGIGLTTYSPGDVGGEESVTVIVNTMPSHNHAMRAAAISASTSTPGAGQMPAQGHGAGRGAFTIRSYAPPSGNGGTSTTLAPASVGFNGGTQPHENRQPSLVMTWCIATAGIFPTRN